MSKRIEEKQQEVIEAFELFDDWMDKYNYLIELGKSLEPMNPELKNDKYLIRGCQSRVWLHARLEDEKMLFSADSDALITKGIVGLLVQVLSGHPPKEVLNADMGFIDKIGLKEHLSQTRSNGLLQMIKQIKMYALAFESKLS